MSDLVYAYGLLHSAEKEFRYYLKDHSTGYVNAEEFLEGLIAGDIHRAIAYVVHPAIKAGITQLDQRIVLLHYKIVYEDYEVDTAELTALRDSLANIVQSIVYAIRAIT